MSSSEEGRVRKGLREGMRGYEINKRGTKKGGRWREGWKKRSDEGWGNRESAEGITSSASAGPPSSHPAARSPLPPRRPAAHVRAALLLWRRGYIIFIDSRGLLASRRAGARAVAMG